MVKIEIGPFLKPTISSVRLHSIKARIKVSGRNAELKDEINRKIESLQSTTDLDEIAEIEPNKFTRIAYKSLGKDPSRYRPSAEALLRRVVKGKGLYEVNNVVDIINLLSISTGYSIGGYDTDKIEGEIVFKKGERTPYLAIGRGELNIENLPVLYDQKGPFGSPTSDSKRTAINEDTRQLLLVFFDFQPQSSFEMVKQDTYTLLEKYASGGEFDYQQIEG